MTVNQHRLKKFSLKSNGPVSHTGTETRTCYPGHNLLKHFRKTEHHLSFFFVMCCFPPPPAMLVSCVCLGINVFEINIGREGKEKFASVSTIMTGNVVISKANRSYIYAAYGSHDLKKVLNFADCLTCP